MKKKDKLDINSHRHKEQTSGYHWEEGGQYRGGGVTIRGKLLGIKKATRIYYTTGGI